MPEQDSTIDWSYSNARLYTSCPRALFYRYWHREDSDFSPIASDGATLGGPTSSEGALIGTAIHDALSAHISRWSQGEMTGLRRTQKVAQSSIHSALEEHPTFVESAVESLIRTTDSHIKRFFRINWPVIRSHRYIIHEESRSFDIDGTTVWVRPDLCTRSPPEGESEQRDFVIYDWKTRQPTLFEDPSLQLRVYALWAHREFEPDLDRISPRLLFTSNGHVEYQSIGTETIRQLKERIMTDVREWGSPTDESSFPAEPERDKCDACPYLESCAAGQQKLAELDK